MNWQTAYALQAKSDLEARDCLLRSEDLPSCHQLHYLQMACEKLCKAHLIRKGTDPQVLRKSHAYIAKPLPTIARQILSREAGRQTKNTWVIDAIKRLARQIELLAPAVDDDKTVLENCEYPWPETTGHIVVPAQHNFKFSLLHEKAGVTLLKVVRLAIDEVLKLYSGERQ